jgi:hypothetical protein
MPLLLDTTGTDVLADVLDSLGHSDRRFGPSTPGSHSPAGVFSPFNATVR